MTERLLGRLHDDGVAGDQSGRNHSAEDRQGEIPRRDDKGDAARPVVLIALLAVHVLGELRPANQPHLLRVKVAKIDRLADVAIGFRPGFADFENFQRGNLEATTIHDGGDAFEQLGARFDRGAAPFLERGQARH